MDCRRKQEHYVHRIGKSLLIFRIVRAIGIEFTPVISGLDLASHLGSVGIAVAKQQFTCPEPTGIEVRQVPARSIVTSRIALLVGDEHPLHVEPHAPRHQQCSDNADCGAITQSRDLALLREQAMLQLMRLNLCD